jgi:hypothetical protein
MPNWSSFLTFSCVCVCMGRAGIQNLGSADLRFSLTRISFHHSMSTIRNAIQIFSALMHKCPSETKKDPVVCLYSSLFWDCTIHNATTTIGKDGSMSPSRSIRDEDAGIIQGNRKSLLLLEWNCTFLLYGPENVLPQDPYYFHLYDFIYTPCACT